MNKAMEKLLARSRILDGIVWKTVSRLISKYADELKISEEKIKEHIRQSLEGDEVETEEGKKVVAIFDKEVAAHAKEYSPLTENIIRDIVERKLAEERS